MHHRHFPTGSNSIVCQALVVAIIHMVIGTASAQWITFQNQTATRLVAAPSLGATDTDEKDYAWGDVDNDGDIDLVNVRKQEWTSPGKRVNVLFMNEDGVLTDRSAQYASTADVAGDLGFLTPTNDRDVVLTDVNLDGWLDVVTATAISDGDPKHIGHPRVYINIGEDGNGDWLGFRFENDRIPAMLSYTGQAGFNPRFGCVAAGDVTGDGYPDLWFGDHDSSGAGGTAEPAGADFNDKLLINLGSASPGFFIDATATSFSGLIVPPSGGAAPFPVSSLSASAAIADLNGDGLNDIIKQTALNSPLYLGIAYNSPSNVGFFNTYEVIYQLSPMYVSVGELNNDALVDLVVTAEGLDRYLLNQGNGADGLADFNNLAFPTITNGFGSQSVIADLDKDGWNDVLIADVDFDISGCSRTTAILRNNGDAPDVSFTSDPGNIPNNQLRGVHNIAVFDINGDTWLDLVVGRCSTTEVWIQQPPPCPCPGDMDDNGVLDGRDIRGLVDCLTGGGSNCGCADLNLNLTLETLDGELFVVDLLSAQTCD